MNLICRIFGHIYNESPLILKADICIRCGTNLDLGGYGK